MKFATIAASVLVASSVLATAGVVSANDISTTSGIGQLVEGSDTDYTATGKASVDVVKGKDAQFTIDKVAGLAKASGDRGFDFGTVTLTELAKNATSSLKREANFDQGAFEITNTMGVQKWNLTAVMDKFTDGTPDHDFNGNLAINDKPLTLNTDTVLYSSTDADGFTNANDNGSKSKWMSPAGQATMLVPTNAKVGNYTAKITYKLSATPTSDTTSNNDTALPANPVSE